MTPADLAVVGYGEQDVAKGSLRGDVRLPNEDIGRNLGVFGDLVKKLPPDLRRAGRDVLNDIRRRVPIGPITGGRAFPPFRIPPLNI